MIQEKRSALADPFLDEVIEAMVERDIPLEGLDRTSHKKPIEDLALAMELGEIVWNFQDPRDNVLHNHVSVVDVRYGADGAELMLVEHHRVLPNGGLYYRPRVFTGTLGEKIRLNARESPYAAAVRGLAEELGPADDRFKDSRFYKMPTEYRCLEKLGPRESEFWPKPLEDLYHRRIYPCAISKALFKPEGYVSKEIKDGKVTEIHFKWIPARS
jgi:hypothetical protein